jgi:hypothetical protein
MKSWIITIEEDENGELYLPLNQDILDLTKWKEGDIIEWSDNKDGSWTMKLKQDMEWVLVDTVSQFRMRYMVQVPVGKKEWALDTVTMNEAKEFSQEHIGETIVSHRVVTEEEAIQICDEDNDYCKTWSDEKKIDVFFTKEGEKVEL